MGYNNSTAYSESLALAPKSAIFYYFFVIFLCFYFLGGKTRGRGSSTRGRGTISKVL